MDLEEGVVGQLAPEALQVAEREQVAEVSLHVEEPGHAWAGTQQAASVAGDQALDASTGRWGSRAVGSGVRGVHIE